MDYNVTDIAKMALRQIGVGAEGTSPSQDDINDIIMHLNMMLAQWQRNNLYVPYQAAAYCPINGSPNPYTVGPGGDIDLSSRPANLRSVFLRIWGGTGGSGNTQDSQAFDASQFSEEFYSDNGAIDSNGRVCFDIPLQCIPSLANWSTLVLKNMSSSVSTVYNYNPAYPYGELRIWPIPLNSFKGEVHIVYDAILPSNLTANDTFNLPPEYLDAIMWNLAARASISYGETASPALSTFAFASLETISAMNYRPIIVKGNPSSRNELAAGFFLSNLFGKQ